MKLDFRFVPRCLLAVAMFACRTPQPRDDSATEGAGLARVANSECSSAVEPVSPPKTSPVLDAAPLQPVALRSTEANPSVARRPVQHDELRVCFEASELGDAECSTREWKQVALRSAAAELLNCAGPDHVSVRRRLIDGLLRAHARGLCSHLGAHWRFVPATRESSNGATPAAVELRWNLRDLDDAARPRVCIVVHGPAEHRQDLRNALTVAATDAGFVVERHGSEARSDCTLVARSQVQCSPGFGGFDLYEADVQLELTDRRPEDAIVRRSTLPRAPVAASTAALGARRALHGALGHARDQVASLLCAPTVR